MPVAVARISEDVLAEQWFDLKHQILAKLQVAFRESGLKQEDIAVRLGKQPAVISRCLRGRQNMTVETMHNLARGMDCRLRIDVERLDTLAPTNRRPKSDAVIIQPGKPAGQGQGSSSASNSINLPPQASAPA